MTGRWRPRGTQMHFGRPPVGRLVALYHAVYRVDRIREVELSDEETSLWISVGMPDPWDGRPYRVDVGHVGGVLPDRLIGTPHRELGFRAPANRWSGQWDVYPESGRWPQCSCCGEPMPCRAQLRDDAVAAASREVDRLASRLPGCCWGCGEPITRRQHAVSYAGANVDLPGGPPVTIHLRAACRSAAREYEERWLLAEPGRQRIITYPRCAGTLAVHGDGSTECHGGEADCAGHATHDHRSVAACWTTRGGCPRGCGRDGHPGCRLTPRPARRDLPVLDGGP